MTQLGCEVVEGIIITIVGTVAAAIILRFRKHWKKLRAWSRGQKLEAERIAQRNEVQQLKVLREQIIDVARQTGKVIPVSSKGVNPTTVTFSDGGVRHYFTKPDKYRSALNSQFVPPHRSYFQQAPSPVSRWGRDRLMKWLEDNVD